MIEIERLIRALEEIGAGRWASVLPEQLATALCDRRHGDFDRWMRHVDSLPADAATSVYLDRDAVTAQGCADLQHTESVEQALMALHPWRKGPFDLCGVVVDAEWRSDRKWARVGEAIAPLHGRAVLDIGCGNGYYLWRMLGAGARLVVGVDPTQLFLAQFLAAQRLLGSFPAVSMLPLGIEQIPAGLAAFDTVFSMGILYHRRSPIDHLIALRDLLRPDGELVLETLVIDGGGGEVLVPAGRYAKMRNVWFIPSAVELAAWLRRCGFRQVRVVDLTVTGTDEQRSTQWMRFESLSDFLDPDDTSRTVEGYPAPLRAILLANAP